MNKELKRLLDEEGAAAELAEGEASVPLPPHVKVTRGHDRSKVLQVRLNESELERISEYAASLGLPVSTAVRALLLGALTAELGGKVDLQSVLDRLERDVRVAKQIAQSA